jgi:hypothetical protein
MIIKMRARSKMGTCSCLIGQFYCGLSKTVVPGEICVTRPGTCDYLIRVGREDGTELDPEMFEVAKREHASLVSEVGK